MAVSRQQKEAQLASLIEKMGKSTSTVFAQNTGISVKDLEQLRRVLREKGAELSIAKKTLIRKAAASTGFEAEIPSASMEGPVAVVFSYTDAVSGVKTLADFAKKTGKLTLLGGLMEGRVLSISDVKALSTLLSREELLAKLMGSMLSPLSGFVGMGNAVIGGFVRVLDAHAKKQAA